MLWVRADLRASARNGSAVPELHPNAEGVLRRLVEPNPLLRVVWVHDSLCFQPSSNDIRNNAETPPNLRWVHALGCPHEERSRAWGFFMKGWASKPSPPAPRTFHAAWGTDGADFPTGVRERTPLMVVDATKQWRRYDVLPFLRAAAKVRGMKVKVQWNKEIYGSDVQSAAERAGAEAIPHLPLSEWQRLL
eukprot:gene19711-22489_t